MKLFPRLLLLFLLLMSHILVNSQSNEILSLSFLYPDLIPANQESAITLSGTGFEPGMSVNLSNVGTVPKTFIDANTLTIQLPSLAAGTYSVTIVKPDGSSSNALNLLVLTENTVQPIVTTIEPHRIQQGTETTISIFGSGFTDDLVVRLQGYGLIPTSFVNSAALTAEVPSSLPARETYRIELISGTGIFYPTEHSLRIVLPAQPSRIPETAATEIPLPTEAPVEPNLSPLLHISSFSVNPQTIDAGQTATVNFTIQNRGNDTARMISVNLASGAAFVPATGQVAVALPDLAPGASASGQMLLSSSLDIAAGPTIIPLVIDYQNPMGDSFSANADLSVTVNSAPSDSQLVINAYTIEPSPSEAGQAVRLQLTLFNVGESAITQVLLSVDGGVLIPQGRGNTIPIGDIEGRQTAPVELSMLVNSSAEAGYQMQSISITYQQNGETHEVSSSIMVNVVASSRPQPLLLLVSYQNSLENLQPGSRFNLSIELENAGAAAAQNTLITFGTGQAEAGDAETMLSVSFAPLGSAGLDFVGDIESGASISSSQEFMVSGSLASGIYPLPITLQYTLPDGTSKTETLNISLVVIAPPQLQFSPQQPLPETVYAGDFVPLSIEIINNGHDVNFQEALFTVDNGEIIEGANIDLNILKEGEETSIEAMLLPSEEGDLNLSLTLHYNDELNQAQSIVLTYSSLVIAAPSIEDLSFEDPIIYEEELIPEETNSNWFGRMMMAFFGLGS